MELEEIIKFCWQQNDINLMVYVASCLMWVFVWVLIKDLIDKKK